MIVFILNSVEQKLSGGGFGLNGEGCYNICEAQAIMTELHQIQRSLSSGEKERVELMQSLAKLKDDLTRLQLCNESSPDASTLSIPPVSNTASQTDLSEEVYNLCFIFFLSLQFTKKNPFPSNRN